MLFLKIAIRCFPSELWSKRWSFRQFSSVSCIWDFWTSHSSSRIHQMKKVLRVKYPLFFMLKTIPHLFWRYLQPRYASWKPCIFFCFFSGACLTCFPNLIFCYIQTKMFLLVSSLRLRCAKFQDLSFLRTYNDFKNFTLRFWKSTKTVFSIFQVQRANFRKISLGTFLMSSSRRFECFF